jgi:hypothetical protein
MGIGYPQYLACATLLNLPGAGYHVRVTTRVPTGHKLHQGKSLGQASHQVRGVGPVLTGLGAEIHHVIGVLIPEVNKKPDPSSFCIHS